MRFLPVFLASPLAFAVAACGGGSGSTDGSRSFDVVETFSGGAGIVRTDVSGSGDTITVAGLVPDVDENNAVSKVLGIDPAGLSSSSSNAYGDFFEGAVTVDGELAQVLFYEDSSNSAGILISDAPSGVSMLTLGPEATNIPGGTATYQGTNIVVAREGSGSFYQSGTFGMSVNFGTGNSSINASTANSSLTGSGIVIDAAKGTFSGSGLTMTVNGETRSALIHGNFHGDGAAGVSGVYTQDIANPAFVGAIAGTKP